MVAKQTSNKKPVAVTVKSKKVVKPKPEKKLVEENSPETSFEIPPPKAPSKKTKKVVEEQSNSNEKVTQRKPKKTETEKEADKKVPKNVSSEGSGEEKKKNTNLREFELVPGSVCPQGESPVIETPLHKNDNGSYKNRVPSQAASKCFTRICKAAGVDEVSYGFAIREKRVANSKPKWFIGVRSKRDEPKLVPKGNGNTYAVNYQSKVMVWHDHPKDE